MSEGKARGSPIKFRVVSFKPICSKDDIVGTNISYIEFGAFLMIVVIQCCNMNGLDSYEVDGPGCIWGTINIFDQ